MLRKIWIILTGVAMASPSFAATADCFVCDQVVVFNQRGAECFLRSYRSIAANIAGEGAGRAEFDLSSCPAGDETKDRGGLSVMPTIGKASAPAVPVKTTYVFDAETARCLKQQIEHYSGSYDPAATFDLAEACGQ